MTPRALGSAWARIVEEHGADEDGVVPIGGAALIRVNDREAEAISGGEDALDSLEWAVNDVLGEALKGADVLVVAEESAITADTALRLGCYFEMGPQFWLNLQSRYELELAQERVAEIEPLHVA
ncbi:helix-turn-helix transcriptional regulator [Brevibacterium paucivorans]